MRRNICISCCVGVALLWSGAAAQQARFSQVSVYLENSPAAQELVDRAVRLRQQGRLAEAVTVFQQVIDQYPQKLMTTHDNAVHTDAARWVREALLVDAQWLGVYRRQQGAASEKALEEASLPVPRINALESVLARFWLCPAGLEAGLRLAGVCLEMGRVTYGGAVLRELGSHPDLPDQAARWHLLQAAVGLFGNRPDHYAAHLRALRDLGDQASVSQVEGWSNRLHLPVATHTVDSLNVQPGVQIPDSFGVPLWKEPILDALDQDAAGKLKRAIKIRGGRVRIRGRVQVRQRRAGLELFYPVIPTAASDRLYIADMSDVFSLDRSSGRRYWTYRDDESADRAKKPAVFRGRSFGLARARDSRAVLVHGDRLYSVVGVPAALFGRRRPKGYGVSLVCLEQADGQRVWRVEPGDLDPALTDADFYGTPVYEAGGVLVLVKRHQRSGFKDTYLLAMDAQTGQLIWRRHLFSVTTPRNNLQEPVQMTTHLGRIYVADGLGNAACLEARNGSVLWLTVLKDDLVGDTPKRPQPDHVRAMRWKLIKPVLVDAGVVVSIESKSFPAVVLDPLTGQVRRWLTGPEWAGGGYIMPTASGDVLVIGRDVRLMDGSGLTQRWSRSLGVPVAEGLSGLAAVTENRILIPTRKKLIVLDLSRGRVEGQYPIDEPGNILALPDQVVIAGSSSLRGYLSWGRAYEHLTKQIADHPDDPEPALALAHISLAANQHEAVLEGVDHAIEAMARHAADQPQVPSDAPPGQSVQGQVFEQLLGLVDPQKMPSVVLRRHLFDRLATVTSGPGDEVAYHLAHGAFLVELGKPEKAADHYQTILNDLTLSMQIYHQDTVRRQAGIEAKSRLAKLISEFGPRVYARYEAEAAQGLVELTQSKTPDVSALIELARRYWLSRTAPVAMLAAARALAQQGDRPAALGQLRRAYRYTTEAALLQRIVGLMVELYQQAGQPRRASQWLTRVRRNHPGLQPLQDGRPVSIDLWLEQLVDRPTINDHLPSLTLPLGEPVVWSERVLVPTHQPRSSWPGDKMVTLDQKTLKLRGGSDLKTLWSVRLPQEGVQLLSLTSDQVLLWFPKHGALWALDTDTGNPIWPWLDVLGGLEKLATDSPPRGVAHGEHPLFPEAAQRTEADPQGGVGAVRGRQQIKIGVNELAVCVGDQRGRIVGINRRTGKVLWRLASALTSLDLLEIDEDVVALAGRSGASPDARNGAILVLDAMSGEALVPMIDRPDKVRWLGLSEEGILVYATMDQVVALDLRSGEEEWGLVDSGLAIYGQGWVGHNLLLLRLEQFRGTLLAIRPTTGRVVKQIPNLFSDSSSRLSLQNVEDRWHVLSPYRVSVLDEEGRVRWRDAIYREDGQERVLQLIGKKYVVVLCQEETKGDTFRYSIYLINRTSGVIEYEHKLAAMDKPIDTHGAVFLENRLVFFTASSTLVIPGGGRLQ